MLPHEHGRVQIVHRVAPQTRMVADHLCQHLGVPFRLDEQRRTRTGQRRVEPGGPISIDDQQRLRAFHRPEQHIAVCDVHKRTSHCVDRQGRKRRWRRFLEPAAERLGHDRRQGFPALRGSPLELAHQGVI